MTTKQQVEQVLQELPDDCTMEEVQYQLYLSELIRRRAQMSESTAGIPHDQMLKRIATWRAKSSRSSGPPAAAEDLKQIHAYIGSQSQAYAGAMIDTWLSWRLSTVHDNWARY